MPEIVSRKEAIARGLKRYFTGEPCKHGHTVERRVSGGDCVVCKIERQKSEKYMEKRRVCARRSYKRNPEKWADRYRKSYEKNPEKYSIRNKNYYLKNLEKVRAERRKSMEKHREIQKTFYRKRAALIRALRLANPELLREFGL